MKRLWQRKPEKKEEIGVEKRNNFVKKHLHKATFELGTILRIF